MNIALIRVWILRLLVLLIAGLVIASFIFPWWTINVEIDPESGALEQPPDVVRIYAYGLLSDLTEMEDLVEEFITPHYQTVLAFIFLGVSISILLISTWIRGRKGQVILGIIGLIYIGYGLGLYIMLSNNCNEKGIPIQGEYVFETHALVTNSFEPFYYTIFIAGSLLIILALLRGFLAPSLKK